MAKRKILIVDYDKKSLEKLTELFTSQGFQIIKAADGQAAYDIYKKEKPDLMLIEAMLPKLHGFDLTQKIYSETKGAIPVVIVTGLYKGPQYKNEAIRSFGAADYFEKPYDKEKLVSSIKNLLHDEIDIKEELPDPASVIAMISEMIPKKDSSKKRN
jgi:DNA-binding response OmpR family regulator